MLSAETNNGTARWHTDNAPYQREIMDAIGDHHVRKNNRLKRSHWGIENQLHWVLDMQLREDESRARADNSAENLNGIRHWAYNLLKTETSVRGSFSDKQFKCLLDESFLDKIVRSVFCS